MRRLIIPTVGILLFGAAMIATRLQSADLTAEKHVPLQAMREPRFASAPESVSPVVDPTPVGSVTEPAPAAAVFPTPKKTDMPQDPITAPAANMDAPRVIIGNSPIPTGGKPVAAVEAAWNITVTGDRFAGDIVLTPRSGPSRLEVRVIATDGAILDAAVELVVPAAPRDQPVTCAVAGRLGTDAGDPPAAGGRLSVFVRTIGETTRGRAFGITLVADAAGREKKQQADQGVRIVTDDTGGRTILMPAAPPR